MKTFGILFLGLLYFAAGGLLGTAVYEIWRGHGQAFLSEPIPLWFTIGSNAQSTKPRKGSHQGSVRPSFPARARS